MKVTEKIYIENCDNMELMARYPDNYFDLAIVDPPYGIGASKFISKDSGNKRKNSATKKGIYKVKDWDVSSPNLEYFNELKRVSKNQIIWGANHFTSKILNDSSCWIIWDKMIAEDMGFSKAELAWTSFDYGVNIAKIQWSGMLQPDMKNKEIRIHPTQKPNKLYKWILDKYAKPNDKILDTHLGSGSIAIACHDYNFELTCCELDVDYYNKAVERIKNHISQIKLDF